MRRWLLLLLGLLFLLNLLVYVYRDHFAYKPVSGYQELYGPCDDACRRKWGRFAEAYDAKEVQLAAKAIKDSFHFTPSTTDEEKIYALAGMVMKIFVKKHGRPSAAFLRQSPFQQYEDLCLRDSGRLWCGNLAQIFSFFCLAEGITTRNIEIRNPGDHHVVNECYLAEKQKWVLIDIPHGLVMMEDNTGRQLDLQTFRKAVLAGEKLWSVNRAKEKSEKIPFSIAGLYYEHFYRGAHPHYYYYQMDGREIYSTGKKLSRYFLPVSWYEVYSEKDISNWKFYLRQVLLVSFLLVLMAAGSLFLKKKHRD